MKIVTVVGARPNLMKIAPLIEELRGAPGRRSGAGPHRPALRRQHVELFFEELGHPRARPTIWASARAPTPRRPPGSCSAFEPLLESMRPDLVRRRGRRQLHAGRVRWSRPSSRIPVAHVEAGLRSFDRTMPEEINRVLTDAARDLLFCHASAAPCDNLRREGVRRLAGPLRRQRDDRHAAAPPRAGPVPADARRGSGWPTGTTRCSRCTGRPTWTTRAVLAGSRGRPRGESQTTAARSSSRCTRGRARRLRELRAAAPGRATCPASSLVEPLGYLDFLGLMAAGAAAC